MRCWGLSYKMYHLSWLSIDGQRGNSSPLPSSYSETAPASEGCCLTPQHTHNQPESSTFLCMLPICMCQFPPSSGRWAMVDVYQRWLQPSFPPFLSDCNMTSSLLPSGVKCPFPWFWAGSVTLNRAVSTFVLLERCAAMSRSLGTKLVRPRKGETREVERPQREKPSSPATPVGDQTGWGHRKSFTLNCSCMRKSSLRHMEQRQGCQLSPAWPTQRIKSQWSSCLLKPLCSGVAAMQC